MAKQSTCHTCVYAWWEPGLWMRTMWSGFPARPVCGNQPGSYGRMKECPCGACRNYRARPPVPTGENVKRIPLGNGIYAYVDPEDYERLSRFHWRAYSAGYAGRWEKGKLIYMHREIMKPPRERSWTTSMAMDTTIPGPTCGTSRQGRTCATGAKYVGTRLHLQGYQLRQEASSLACAYPLSWRAFLSWLLRYRDRGGASV